MRSPRRVASAAGAAIIVCGALAAVRTSEPAAIEVCEITDEYAA